MPNMPGDTVDMFKEHESVMLNSNTGPEDYHIAIGVILLLLMCFGLFCNVAVINTYRLRSALQTPTNVLIIGKVASDTAIIVIGFPFVIASCFNGYWMFGSAWCEGYGFISTLLGVTNMCIMTAVALDRYVVVTQSPVTVKITTFKAVMTIWTCLGYGLLWATFPLVGWGSYNVEYGYITCGPDWENKSASSQSYSVTMFVLVLIVPICVILYCYVQIMLKVRSHQVGAMDQISSLTQIEIRMAFSVFLTIFTFLAAWSPYATLSFWTMMNDIKDLNSTVAVIAPLLAKSCSVWNPLVYAVRNKDFREAFIAVTFRYFRRNRNHDNVDSSMVIDVPNGEQLDE